MTQELGQSPAEHHPSLNHRSPTEAGMGVHPICSLLVPLGRVQAIIHPWGWDWQSCSPTGAAGPRTHSGWCTVGARIRPGVRAHPPAQPCTPHPTLAPAAPSAPLARGTGLISIIFSRPYEFY